MLVGDSITEKIDIPYRFNELIPPENEIDDSGVSQVSFDVSYNDEFITLLITSLPENSLFARIREVMYADCDVVVMCYSMKSLQSLDNLVTKWLPELADKCSNRILVGNHCKDVTNLEVEKELFEKREEVVATNCIEETYKEVNAKSKFQVQSDENIGLEDLFKSVVRVGMDAIVYKKEK